MSEGLSLYFHFTLNNIIDHSSQLSLGKRYNVLLKSLILWRQMKRDERKLRDLLSPAPPPCRWTGARAEDRRPAPRGASPPPGVDKGALRTRSQSRATMLPGSSCAPWSPASSRSRCRSKPRSRQRRTRWQASCRTPGSGGSGSSSISGWRAGSRRGGSSPRRVSSNSWLGSGPESPGGSHWWTAHPRSPPFLAWNFDSRLVTPVRQAGEWLRGIRTEWGRQLTIASSWLLSNTFLLTSSTGGPRYGWIWKKEFWSLSH